MYARRTTQTPRPCGRGVHSELLFVPPEGGTSIRAAGGRHLKWSTRGGLTTCVSETQRQSDRMFETGGCQERVRIAFGGQRQAPEVSESHALVDSVPSDSRRGNRGPSAWALDGRCRLTPAAIDFPLIGLFPAPETPDKVENRKATLCAGL